MLNDPPRIAYQLFILALSVISIALIAVEVLAPVTPEVSRVIGIVDTFICAVFFFDFTQCLIRAPNRKQYMLRYGWLDLLACIPSVEPLRAGRALRATRIIRLLRGLKSSRVLVSYFVAHKAISAFWTAILAGIVSLTFASIAILHVEGPHGTISTAGDALWWSIVTSTTVGYGDLYPTTMEGRLIGAMLMIIGVAILGVLTASIASMLVQREEPSLTEITALRSEIAELRELLRSKQWEGR